jgi:hypothetical protein
MFWPRRAEVRDPQVVDLLWYVASHGESFSHMKPNQIQFMLVKIGATT